MLVANKSLQIRRNMVVYDGTFIWEGHGRSVEKKET